VIRSRQRRSEVFAYFTVQSFLFSLKMLGVVTQNLAKPGIEPGSPHQSPGHPAHSCLECIKGLFLGMKRSSMHRPTPVIRFTAPPGIICQGFHRSQRWQCLKETWTIGVGTCPNTIIIVRYLIRNRERRHFRLLRISPDVYPFAITTLWPGCIEWIAISRKREMVVV